MKAAYAEPVKIQVSLNENGKLMSSTTLRSRQATLRFVQGKFPSKTISVTAVVWYNVKEKFYNEFTANSYKAFKASLDACTETSLVEDFK